MKISTIVTDIEGTTSSISFVHDVLFPYSLQALPEFLYSQQNEPEIKELLNEVAKEAGIEAGSLDSIIEVLQVWIQEDRKISPLKQLQGHIWFEGYHHGSLQGHVYLDAFEELQQWYKEGKKIYVYSSGSVKAQKLLFGHSVFGDLTNLFSGYFDTSIGGKKEKTSYEKMLASLNQPGKSVVFLSDVETELKAAQLAGLKVILLCREEQSVQSQSGFPCASNFKEVSQLIELLEKEE